MTNQEDMKPIDVSVKVVSDNQTAAECVAGAINLSLAERGFTNVTVEANENDEFPNLPTTQEEIDTRMEDAAIAYDSILVGTEVVIVSDDEE